MLEGLVRELSNWRKGKKKTVDTFLYLEELGGLIEKLGDCKLSDVKYSAIMNLAPKSGIRGRRMHKYTDLPKGHDKELVIARLDTLMRSQPFEEDHNYSVHIHHEVYTGAEGERHYLDVYRHIRSEPWWFKVMSIEYSAVPG